jgi:hypothetical protein
MKKVMGLLLFLAILAPGATYAQQYDWQVRNSMKTHLEQLNQYCPVAARPDDLGRCKSLAKNVRGQVDRVEPQNRGIVEFKKVAELLAKIEKKIPEWENAEKADAEAKRNAGKVSDEFKEKVRSHGIIGSIWGMKTDPKKRVELLADLLLKDVERAKAMEKDFLEPCKAGRYANAQTFSRDTAWDHPKNACDVAQNWRAYFKAYVERVVGHVRDETTRTIGFHLKKLEEKGELYEFDMPRMEKPDAEVAGFVTKYEAICKEFGIPLDAAFFQTVVDAAKPWAETLKKAGGVQRWDSKASFSDGAVSAAFKKALGDAKLSVKKIGLTHSDYSITKNSIGIPLYKIRSGFAMVKADGESFCRIYYLTARAEYEGGRKGYTKPSLEFDRKTTGFIVSKCK